MWIESLALENYSVLSVPCVSLLNATQQLKYIFTIHKLIKYVMTTGNVLLVF